jgi:hypothetical protein
MNINKITAKKYITVAEASTLFNKSISTIRKIIELNKVVYKKHNNRLLIELESIEKVYNTNKKQVISVDTDDVQDIKDSRDELIRAMKSEIDNLKIDKVKLYEDIESRRTSQMQVQKLLENQQTLSLGLQQQIKSLTDNSNQNSQEKLKSNQTTVEAKVSNTSKTSKNTQNYDLFNESNEIPIEIKNTSEKRRKWWFF